MPVVSGGGVGGNTTTQVVASGKVVPVADATGVTVDSTTYADSIRGGGAKLTTLVFAVDQGAVAVALAGDAFPRSVMGADPNDFSLWAFGDGTYDPAVSGCSISLTSGGQMLLASHTGEVTLNSGAGTSVGATQLGQVSPRFTITSGALPTVQLVTATGAQILTTRDAETITPCTFNPGAATTATVTVALSPDNVTYSTLGIETEPAGVAFDGTIRLVKVRVPAGWYLKLTVNAQAVLGLTTYY